LKEHLAARLPSYMLPAAFVALDQLPLTPNGKVDRKALPAPERSGLEQAYVAPRNATEEKLTAIWAEVLKVERVGVNDNFFETGGNSILTFRVVTKAQEAGLQLNVMQMFQHQTVAQLAAMMEQTSGAGAKAEAAMDEPVQAAALSDASRTRKSKIDVSDAVKLLGLE
jgi:aryl carrier-like protein